MDPADFRLTLFPATDSVSSGDSSTSETPSNSIALLANNILSNEVNPATTIPPVVGERVTRSSSPDQTLVANLFPGKTPQSENQPLDFPMPKKHVDLDVDLSLLRYFRDNIKKINLERFVRFCEYMQGKALSGERGYNSKKLGDFFIEAMAASPELRTKMCVTKVKIKDVDNPYAETREILTNATTFLNDYGPLKLMMEDLPPENLANLTLDIVDNQQYAEQVIHYLETGNEDRMKDLDVFELALLATKWMSPRLQSYCKKHLEVTLKTLDEKFKETLTYLACSMDPALDYLFLPMAARAIENLENADWNPLWLTLSADVQKRVQEASERHIEQATSVSFRNEHPDRVRYSLELIKYINSVLSGTFNKDDFYAADSDLEEALRIVFHAAIHCEKTLNTDDVYFEVQQLKESVFTKKNKLPLVHNVHNFSNVLLGWCCTICNHIQPNLPEEILQHPAWHGETLKVAIDENISDGMDVLKASDDFVTKALSPPVKKKVEYQTIETPEGEIVVSDPVPLVRNVLWLLRPTTRFASRGVFTVCAYDNLKKKEEKARFQYFEGKYYYYDLNRETRKFERFGNGELDVNTLVRTWITITFKVGILNSSPLIAPTNRKERQQQYLYIE